MGRKYLYNPIKLKKALEFGSKGLLRRNIKELIEMSNYLFDKNDDPEKICAPCSITRYRNVISNFCEKGKKYFAANKLDIEEEVKKLEENNKPKKKGRKKKNDED